MELNQLIKEITPFYNTYRKNKFTLSGTQSLIYFWEVGNILEKYITTNKIAPHNLYRTIYGKSEGKNNITQKSYITREFLSRALRIRKIFRSIEDIESALPNLKRFRLFAQAMPFIDNPKYAFKGKKREDLLNLLNSQKTYKEIIFEIHRLQKENIGIKNPRKQKLLALEKDKQVFIEFYNFVVNLLRINDYEKARSLLSGIDVNDLKILSTNTGAISTDGLKMYETDKKAFENSICNNFYNQIRTLTKNNNQALRRRFRRIIPPERMLRLSEMLYALTSEENYKKYKR